MSVWLTLDLKPFVGATYFPQHRFIEVLNTLAEKWSSDIGTVAPEGNFGPARDFLYIYYKWWIRGENDFELERVAFLELGTRAFSQTDFYIKVDNTFWSVSTTRENSSRVLVLHLLLLMKVWCSVSLKHECFKYTHIS